MIVLVYKGMITKKFKTKDFKFDPATFVFKYTKEIVKNTKEIFCFAESQFLRSRRIF